MSGLQGSYKALPIAGTGFGVPSSRPAAANEADSWIPQGRIGTQGNRSGADLNRPDSTTASSASALATHGATADSPAPHPLAQLVAMLRAIGGGGPMRPPPLQPMPITPPTPLQPSLSGVPVSAPLPLPVAR